MHPPNKTCLYSIKNYNGWPESTRPGTDDENPGARTRLPSAVQNVLLFTSNVVVLYAKSAAVELFLKITNPADIITDSIIRIQIQQTSWKADLLYNVHSTHHPPRLEIWNYLFSPAYINGTIFNNFYNRKRCLTPFLMPFSLPPFFHAR